jgi:hypothetical protein
VGFLFAAVSWMYSLEQIKVIPEAIIVAKDEAREFLTPVTDALGVALTASRSLKAVEDAKRSLLQFMGR